MRAICAEEYGRIIPARAGFTSSGSLRRKAPSDHPRSRGVYAAPRPRRAWAPGSSPLARGLLRRCRNPEHGVGIIPARAGFTRTPDGGFGRRADHPRSRGVYAPGPFWASHNRGSSPLARGLRCSEPDDGVGTGIIPARAGFTSPSPPTYPNPSDHPRSRGVYAQTRRERTMNDGSSPLARGLRAGPGLKSRIDRIIPARAGFTGARPGGAPGRQDHPRSRGVYDQGRLAQPGQHGSSPLARGLHARGRVHGCVGGIIPARAGFTG